MADSPIKPFLGKWKLISSVNFDQYLKELGVFLRISVSESVIRGRELWEA